jgi:myo-inositol-1(or 4)-monophosphatase
VACGRADVTFESRINAWDVTAGLLLVEQAGGRYMPLGKVGPYTHQYPWLFPGFIATCTGFDLEQSIMKTFIS